MLNNLTTHTLSTTQHKAHSDLLDSLEKAIKPIHIQFKESREHNHMSQEEFSKKIGISNVQLSRIEQAKCRPSISTLCKAAPYIGSDLESLLLAASYSGKIDSSKPIYLDLKGNTLNLQNAAKEMYSIDGELFCLLYSFFIENYQHEDAESLKVLLNCFYISEKAKKNTANFSFFSQLYKTLKSLLVSLHCVIEHLFKNESI